MENSLITWCHHTFNPWIGCNEVCCQCDNCYARELMDNRYHRVKWGIYGTRVLTSEANWNLPLRWNRMAYKSGIRFRVFCASLADVFENWDGVFENEDGTMNEWRLRLLSLIIVTPHLDWLLLTKRPRFAAKFFKTYSPSDVYCAAQNWEREFQGTRKKLTVAGEVARQLRVNETGKYAHKPITDWPLENVWLGVSYGVDPQPILDTPARIHFQSVEPMLEPWKPVGGFDWCLFGGESGKNARPCDEDWIREALHICRLSGTVPFIKQMGSQSFYKGVRQTYKHAHGADINEFPTDLRVQEFPK